MKWYRCNECGEKVREDELGTLVINSEPPFYEYSVCCPACKGIDLDILDTCPLCGIPHEDFKHRLCAGCRTSFKNAFSTTINLLFDNLYGVEGDPDSASVVVEELFNEASDLLDDQDYQKSLANREV